MAKIADKKVRGSFQSYMKNCSSILATDPLCFLSGGSFRACCILWGVPLVEDGVATYMSIFDQPVNSEMGCSLIDICSIIKQA
jgi:hypothetical protein